MPEVDIRANIQHERDSPRKHARMFQQEVYDPMGVIEDSYMCMNG